MEYIYVSQIKDAKIIQDYKNQFETKTLEELVVLYNKQVKCGIVGVHQQALYLFALGEEFKERLKESPVYLLDYVLGLVGKVKIINGNLKIDE
ncbi:hypothetical protein [Aestuariivivens sediminicola]|uniref:hypothetical protein n=1 Tax=Aestuariivivens sediminicola TaxID=2913560 RepID=UPI001F571F57|nr:hypothetical protein [Aestuariivivens sediminicola]